MDHFTTYFGKQNNGKITQGFGIAASFGDSHAAIANLRAHKLAVEISNILRVKDVFFHDLYDMHNDNHHELGNPARAEVGDGSIESELQLTKSFLETQLKALNKDVTLNVVRSNHDDALDRWVKNTDVRRLSRRRDRLTHTKLLLSMFRIFWHLQCIQ